MVSYIFFFLFLICKNNNKFYCLQLVLVGEISKYENASNLALYLKYNKCRLVQWIYIYIYLWRWHYSVYKISKACYYINLFYLKLFLLCDFLLRTPAQLHFIITSLMHNGNARKQAKRKILLALLNDRTWLETKDSPK